MVREMCWRNMSNTLTLINFKVKEAVKAMLDTFETITLEEMDRVKLMDRTDQKFNFNIAQLPELLNEVRDTYRVLEVAGTKMSHYETLY